MKKNLFSLLLLIIALMGCSKKEEEVIEPEPEPVQLTLQIRQPSSPEKPVVFQFNEYLIPDYYDIVEIINEKDPERTTDVSSQEVDEYTEKMKRDIESHISFNPEIKGHIQWDDYRTLVFTPNKGEVYWGMEIDIRVKPVKPWYGDAYASQEVNKTVVYPDYKPGSKVAGWDPEEGFPRFVTALGPSTVTSFIGRGSYYLLYDQPVDVHMIASSVELLREDGTPAEFTASVPEDYTAIEDYGISYKYIVALTLNQEMNEGEKLTLAIPSWSSKSAAPTYLKYKVTYKSSFTLDKIMPVNKLASGRMALKSSWELEFSSPFDLEELRNVLIIEPEPRNLRYRIRSSQKVTLEMELRPGESYDLVFSGNFQDYLGNTLSSVEGWAFQAQDLPSEFVLPDKPIILEPGHLSLPFQGMNLAAVELKVYEFPSAEEYIIARNRGNRPQSASAYGLKKSEMTIIGNYTESDMNTLLSEIFTWKNPFKEGFKCFEFTAKGRGSEKRDIKSTLLVNITDTGITAKVSQQEILAWTASFSKGRVKGGEDIILYNQKGKELARGETDRRGIVTLNPGKKREDLMYLAAGDSSLMVLRSDELSSAWQFSLPGKVTNSVPLKGSLFTERGVYRPGDRVYIKAYSYSAGPEEMNIIVRDPRAKEVLKEKVKTDDFGASDYVLDIPEGASTGRWDILLSNGSSTISGSFKVEEYRVPTFVVSTEDHGVSWSRGDGVKVDISSEYYHGGLMDGRDYSWKVTRSLSPLQLKAYPGYLFQSGTTGDEEGVFTSEKGTLNSEGKASAHFTPYHSVSSGRMLYTFEAVVTDTDRQAYSGRISRFVHPAGRYVGMKPPAREVVRAGTETVFPWVVINTEGEVEEGLPVQAVIEYIQYHTTARNFDASKVQMLNRRVGQKVKSLNLTSEKGPAEIRFTPNKAGIYRLTLKTRDDKGKEVSNRLYITASGDEATAWPRFDKEKIDIIRDKDVYEIGDTAVLIPQSPFEKATGLLTIEHDGIIESRIITVGGDTPEIRIPIQPEYAPNVFVSFVLIRGREHFMTDATGYETGAPGFKIGYVNLDVDPARQRLKVNIDTDLSQVQPGQEVTIPLHVTDYDKKGAEAQITVMVVDEAVLDMTAYKTPDPLGDVYVNRKLGVRTGSNWLDLPHSRRERLEALFPGGDEDPSALGARSDLEKVLRNLFKSTAYWNPDLRTNSEGRAEFTFVMPDNLTSYRVMAVAADKSLRFGSSDHMLVSQQALMIQPVMPRFVYPEDEFQVEAMVFNNTSKKEKISLTAEFEGLTLMEGSPSATVTVDAGKSAQIPFLVKAGISGEALIRFRAETSSEEDGAEYTLPVLNAGTRVTEVKSVPSGENAEVSLLLPAHYIEGTATAELVLSVTELTELKGAVQYLMRYPNGCIEQTTSTAYPLVVLKDLLPVIGVEVDEADLKKFSEAGVKRILSFQTSDGGLSYWPGDDEPHAFATAFGLTALIEAKDKGYDVPDKALAGMADYLEKVLRSGSISGYMPHGGMADADTRALFVMTLGRLGRPQPQYINALWEKRDQLTGFGLSFLAIAVNEMEGGDKSLLEPILEAVKEISTRENNEAFFTREASGGWSMDSPLRTHGASLVAFGSAQTDPAMNSELIAGLLARRQGQMWGNTQENVFGIMGIYEAVGKGTGSSDNIPDTGIRLGNRDISLSSMEAPDDQVRRIVYRDSELEMNPGEEVTASLKGAVPKGYLSLRLSYEIPVKYTDMSAEGSGFTVSRNYEDEEGRPVDLNAIPLGSLVRVRVRVEADKGYNYVAIDDKLPGGLEPLNTTLETTEKVDMGELTMEVQKGLSVLSYQEIRDHRVAFFVDEMLPGVYEFVYMARATTPGTYLRPAGHTEAMYATDNYGRTSSEYVTIK